jgi:hypothetical protein
VYHLTKESYVSDVTFNCQAYEHGACCGQPGELLAITPPTAQTPVLAVACAFHRLALSILGTPAAQTEQQSPTWMSVIAANLSSRFDNDEYGCFAAVCYDDRTPRACVNEAGEYATGIQIGPLAFQLSLCEAHHDYLELLLNAPSASRF